MKKGEKSRRGLFLGIVLFIVLITAFYFQNQFLVLKQAEDYATRNCDVVISLGESVQNAVDSNPGDTKFCLENGIHRFQEVSPKEGNIFDAVEPGQAVMSGARLLTDFSQEGNFWYVDGQTQQGDVDPDHECAPGWPRCREPEDFFIDNVPLRHVASKGEVESGKYYFDYDADRIYFAENPNGKIVETSVTPRPFLPTSDDVTIRNLIIEKYATPVQETAVPGYPPDEFDGWIIEDNVIRFNHGVGLKMSHNTIARRNLITMNGQMGVDGNGNNGLFEKNELSHNNFARVQWGFEAGGSKWVFTDGLVIRDNWVHNNIRAPGLWLDIQNRNALFEGNYVNDNDREGIFYEISYGDTVIRDNIVVDNAEGIFDSWLYGSQIISSESSDVEIYDNFVVAPAGGSGITVLSQDRSGEHGADYDSRNNWVHDNEIYYRTDFGVSGMAADYDEDSFYDSNNRFDRNTYHAADLEHDHWEYMGGIGFSEFQLRGQDINGQADTDIEVMLPSPPEDVGPLWLRDSSCDQEICDGIDNDCDGQIDENSVCVMPHESENVTNTTIETNNTNVTDEQNLSEINMTIDEVGSNEEIFPEETSNEDDTVDEVEFETIIEPDVDEIVEGDLQENPIVVMGKGTLLSLVIFVFVILVLLVIWLIFRRS